MADKIKELLAVLDMPEEEQWGSWRWLFDHNYLPMRICYGDIEKIRMARADLAFRLRDKTDRFNEGLEEVFEHIMGYSTYKDMYYWMCNLIDECECKPIHWIIAALIAKELAKEKL